MENKKFQKKVENFICENCGYEVKGSGYTDHCPECFFSKHVDNFPGDRSSDCGGLMKVAAIELKGQQYSLVYECLKCGKRKKNKVQEQDNFDHLIKIQKELNEKIVK